MFVEAGEENAGLVDIGDGLACFLRLNLTIIHRKALEPYQGSRYRSRWN